MHVGALEVDLHIPHSGSLKSKRMVVRHILETAKGRFDVSAAEVGFQDHWQRAQLGFAAVSGSPRQVEDVLTAVERFVWSHPQLSVLSTEWDWLDTVE